VILVIIMLAVAVLFLPGGPNFAWQLLARKASSRSFLMVSGVYNKADAKRMPLEGELTATLTDRLG
jgi:hypothetical protein